MVRSLGATLALAAAAAALGACQRDPAAWRVVLKLDAGITSAWSVAGSDETFFVGEAGTIVHYDGHGDWCRFAPATDQVLWWVWGASASDVYAGGQGGVLLHWDGRGWARLGVPFATGDPVIYGIWGASADDVWLVGGDFKLDAPGLLLRGNARSGFAPVSACTPPTFNQFKISGVAANDLWTVGGPGDAYHFDGVQLRHDVLRAPGLDATLPADRLITVYARATDDVFAIGGTQNGVVFHWDGAAWSFVGEPDADPLSGGCAARGDDLYVVGVQGTIRRRAAGKWSGEHVDTGLDLHTADCLGNGRVFAVGLKLFDPSPPRTGVIAFRSVDALPTAALHACAEEIVDSGVPDIGQLDLWCGAADDAAVDMAVPIDLATTDLLMSVDSRPPDLLHDLTPGPDIACAKAGPYATCVVQADCCPGLECWEVGQFTGDRRCLRPCTTAADCGGDFGPNPQCAAPGCQVLGVTQKCLPQNVVGCQLPDMSGP
jgi:hypothetical protein